jgi:pimeloyl-ACP methyl ester carboxylesterase
VDDSVDVVLALLQRHGFERAAVLGHSYGSLVAARLVRVAPKVVHTLAVVDPVSAAVAAAAAGSIDDVDGCCLLCMLHVAVMLLAPQVVHTLAVVFPSECCCRRCHPLPPAIVHYAPQVSNHLLLVLD